MAQVRISQAPEGFVTSLITKAQLVTLANEPTKVVQAHITLDDAAASNAQKLEAAQKIIDFLMARQALTTLQPLYRSPGLYKEYIFPQSSVKLDTGVPAFLGICNCQNVEGEEIPLNQPQQLRWSKFEQFFGKSFSHSYLAYAVRGFFQNGGQRCYVVYLKNTTLEALQEGLTALESLNTIDLVCAPDLKQ